MWRTCWELHSLLSHNPVSHFGQFRGSSTIFMGVFVSATSGILVGVGLVGLLIRGCFPAIWMRRDVGENIDYPCAAKHTKLSNLFYYYNLIPSLTQLMARADSRIWLPQSYLLVFTGKKEGDQKIQHITIWPTPVLSPRLLRRCSDGRPANAPLTLA